MFSRATIDAETWDALEDALISADFGPDLTDAIVDELREKVAKFRTTDPADLQRMLRETIEERLSRLDSTLTLSNRPAVVLVVGVNGVGKTTTIGKFAKFLTNYGRTCRRRCGRHLPRGGRRAARDLGRARGSVDRASASNRGRTRHPSPSRPSRRRNATASRSC